MTDLLFSKIPATGPPWNLVFGVPDISICAAVGTSTTVFGQPNTGGLSVSGFSSTAFGTPQSAYHAAGFRQSAFGTASVPLLASGFLRTALGVPNTKLPASGFSTTAYGTPLGRSIQRVNGFTATAFGTPNLLLVASGFSSTVFSLPSLALIVNWGFTSTYLGTPTLRFGQSVTGVPVGTVFGTPYAAFDRFLNAADFASTAFGVPIALRFLPVVAHQGALGIGFRVSRFGSPTTAPSISGVASGFDSTAFGTPEGATSERCLTDGFADTIFGTPVLCVPGRASEVHSTTFGVASARRTQAATGLYRADRFGTPGCVRSNTYLAYGINCSGRFGQPRVFSRVHIAYGFSCSGRFGHPRLLDRRHAAYGVNASGRFGHPSGFCRFNHRTTGGVSTALGTPSAYEIHRVTSIKPGAHTGKPLLTRTPIC